MANSTTGLVWTVDSVGLLTDQPVRVKKITFWPNTAADTATFKCYDFGTANYKTRLSGVTATVSTNAITSTGNFVTANVAAGDGLRVKRTSSGNNVGNYYVVSRDSDDAATVSFATMTDEVSKVYDIDIYTARLVAVLKTAGTEKVPIEIDFGPDGVTLPSLSCTTISSSSDLCYVYIG
jgi:hypothetical protein